MALERVCACGCGEQLKPGAWRLYASRSCAGRINNRKHPKRRRKMRQCKRCENVTAERNNICRECRSLSQTTREEKNRAREAMFEALGKMTIEEALANEQFISGPTKRWVVRYHCWHKNKDIKSGYSCQKCGYSLHTEMCHIIAISKAPVTMTLDEVNDKSNLLILCKNCHWEFDHGDLKINEIKPR